jgi:hypothetical protein
MDSARARLPCVRGILNSTPQNPRSSAPAAIQPNCPIRENSCHPCPTCSSFVPPKICKNPNNSSSFLETVKNSLPAFLASESLESRLFQSRSLYLRAENFPERKADFSDVTPSFHANSRRTLSHLVLLVPRKSRPKSPAVLRPQFALRISNIARISGPSFRVTIHFSSIFCLTLYMLQKAPRLGPRWFCPRKFVEIGGIRVSASGFHFIRIFCALCALCGSITPVPRLS